MCGIAGYVYLQGSGPKKDDRLRKMAQSLTHRGPDGEGYYHTNQVALAHRRLSIIDLETGDQPMFTQERDLCIVFNGKIYNSLSKAAVAAIQSTGSKRETENGWTWWKFIDPGTGEEKLADLLRKT